MSNRTVGKAFEKKCKQLLESFGFVVETANPKLQFIGPGKMISKSHDFFGCVDLIALKKTEDMTYFLQVTTGDASPRKRKVAEIDWNFKIHRPQVWKRAARNKQTVVVHTLMDIEDGRMGKRVPVWETRLVSFGDAQTFEEVLDCGIYEQARTT